MALWARVRMTPSGRARHLAERHCGGGRNPGHRGRTRCAMATAVTAGRRAWVPCHGAALRRLHGMTPAEREPCRSYAGVVLFATSPRTALRECHRRRCRTSPQSSLRRRPQPRTPRENSLCHGHRCDSGETRMGPVPRRRAAAPARDDARGEGCCASPRDDARGEGAVPQLCRSSVICHLATNPIARVPSAERHAPRPNVIAAKAATRDAVGNPYNHHTQWSLRETAPRVLSCG
jgi:hypothetical protein